VRAQKSETPVLLIGAGMIAHDQILPALLQMRREGAIGRVSVCSQRNRSVRALTEAPALLRAFPDVGFHEVLDPAAGANEPRPHHYKRALAGLPDRSVVVVAVPDQLHREIVLECLQANQHVCCVKPLVLRVEHSLEIEREARDRALLVGVEYHKRFDPRSLMARDRYRDGRFGEFRLGCARLMEKWHYRDSNFQNWFTAEFTDSFVYIGCHYVDLVHFITGLLPSAVSVYGVLDELPNGRRGYLWTDARVLWENGACLNVQNSLSYPDAAPGPNTQGMTLYCTGAGRGALLEHSDQYRGVSYSLGEPGSAPGATQYAQPSPDYFLYQDLGGPGLVPTGYGVRSVRRIVQEALRVERVSSSLDQRRQLIAEIDRAGILATPSNSRYNEAVCEAARESIRNGGALVELSLPAV
jgi:predicted dehydrogenase